MTCPRTVRSLFPLLFALALAAADRNCMEPAPAGGRRMSNVPQHCVLTIPPQSVAEVVFDGGDRDLKLELLQGNGTVVADFDTRETGPERVIVSPPSDGVHVLRVTPVEKRSRPSAYTFRVGIRAAEGLDEKRAIAQAVMTNARRLGSGETGEAQTEALSAFRHAGVLWRQLGDREAEAAALLGAGTALHYLGRHEEAADTFSQTLELVDRAEWIQAECLNNLGITLWRRGNFPAAIERYTQSLALLRRIGHRRGETAALSNLGIVHREMGEYEKARQYYTQALPITMELGERGAEAYVRSNLGVVLSFLGQRAAAVASLTRARMLFRGMPNGIRAEGRALLHIATVEFSSGRYDTAARQIVPALRLIQRSGDQRSLGDATMLQARLLAARGNTRAAIAGFERAAGIYRAAKIVGGEASVLHALGELAGGGRNYPLAIEYFSKALAIRRVLGDREAVAESLYGAAAAKRAMGDLRTARAQISEALQLTEEVRDLVAGPQYRMSYFSSKHDHYELAIHIDVDLHLSGAGEGFDKSAFNLSERARSRTLLDTLNANYQTPAVQALRSRMQRLKNSLRFWSYRLSEQAASGTSADRLAATRARVDEVLADYRSLQSDVASASRRPGSDAAGPLSLQQIQGELGSSTSLLQYFVGEERSVAWLVTNGSVEMAVLPKRSTIERLARIFREAAMQPEDSSAGYEAAARAMAAALLPRRFRLPSGRLLIAPDGVLHQIPMSLLRDRKGAPLLSGYDVGVVPSMSSVLARRALRPKYTNPDGLLAIVADPVFEAGDRRVRTASAPRPSSQRFPRLGFTAREARAIAAVAPASETMMKTGFQAGPALFLNGTVTRYRHVHVATHAVIDPVYPEFSSLVFSLVDQSGHPVDGYLRAEDISVLAVRADLVTLSACGTGLGTRIHGEGPLSLARAFLTAGARTVLVSLWSVPDDATSELMTAFYRRLLGTPGISAAAAFRDAQMHVRSHIGRSHPYYWAGWILIGDWQ